MNSSSHLGLAILLAGSLAPSAPGAELMPAAQQNALVQKYCAVCHTDAAKNGGLSLQHFDAAQAPPSLKAMMLSKLTGGVLIEMVREVSSNATAAALVDKKMKSGAMGAAGIPRPDKATIDALIRALAMESAGATEWNIERATAPGVTASIVQEAPSATSAGEAEIYRLIASCNPSTKEGYVQLTWSPIPQRGSFAVSVDGTAPSQYPMEGSEAIGNSSGNALNHGAALMLAETKRHSSPTGFRVPAESLTIRDLFPGESVTFSFADLPKEARQELGSCFPGQPRP